MCKVLMSIKPEHTNSILSGIKKYEFRKVKCKRKIDSIVIYSTYPIMKIVGEVEVKEVLEGTPDYVWSKTKSEAGISEDFFYDYYLNKRTAFAYHLGKIGIYKESKNLMDYGIQNAPQSFVYL